jgi:hypothetical protein
MRENLKKKNNKRNHSLMNTTPCASAKRGLSSSWGAVSIFTK